MNHRWGFAAMLLTQCAFPERPGPPGTVARDAWLDAVCRLLAEDRCVEASKTCEKRPETFPSAPDCERWLAFSMSTCLDVDALFAANAPEVLACADSLDNFSCRRGEFCDDDDRPPQERGVCAPVADMIATACSDTGQ